MEALEKVVEVLIVSRADINLTDNSGRSPLHTASQSGKIRLKHTNDMFEWLKNHSKFMCIILNLKIDFKFLGFEKIVEILLKNGIEVDAKDQNGWTPLFYAAASGKMFHLDFNRLYENTEKNENHEISFN